MRQRELRPGSTDENPERLVAFLPVFGGFTEVLGQLFDIGAQIYSVPSDATLIRLMAGIRIR